MQLKTSNKFDEAKHGHQEKR